MEHKCSSDGFWNCLCGDCGYSYNRDCLYHQAVKNGSKIDNVLIKYWRKNMQICSRGLDEVL